VFLVGVGLAFARAWVHADVGVRRAVGLGHRGVVPQLGHVAAVTSDARSFIRRRLAAHVVLFRDVFAGLRGFGAFEPVQRGAPGVGRYVRDLLAS
jgi:hypothetical protein